MKIKHHKSQVVTQFNSWPRWLRKSSYITSYSHSDIGNNADLNNPINKTNLFTFYMNNFRCVIFYYRFKREF